MFDLRTPRRAATALFAITALTTTARAQQANDVEYTAKIKDTSEDPAHHHGAG